MIHMEEFEAERAQEALRELANQINENIKREIDNNGICYLKDAYKGTFLEQYCNDNVHGFINEVRVD